MIIKWRRLAIRNREKQSKQIGEFVQLSSRRTILKNDWRPVRILQKWVKSKSANLTRLYANYKHLMARWMHKWGKEQQLDNISTVRPYIEVLCIFEPVQTSVCKFSSITEDKL